MSFVSSSHSCASCVFSAHLVVDHSEDVVHQNGRSSSPAVPDLCNLILVLNAAYVQPAMCATIPEHIVRHYRYMRQSSPALIPVIPDFERVKKTNRFQLTLQSESGAARNSVLKHIQLVYKRIRDAYSDTVQEEKRAMLKLILRLVQSSCSSS